MYHPEQGREREQYRHRPEQPSYMRTSLRVLSVAFWVAAGILVVLFALPSFIESIGAWLHWITGISLLVAVLSSGAIAWAEFKSNPIEDAERGEWTNKMLFYGLVFAILFFVAFLYWVSLFFAR